MKKSIKITVLIMGLVLVVVVSAFAVFLSLAKHKDIYTVSLDGTDFNDYTLNVTNEKTGESKIIS